MPIRPAVLLEAARFWAGPNDRILNVREAALILSRLPFSLSKLCSAVVTRSGVLLRLANHRRTTFHLTRPAATA